MSTRHELPSAKSKARQSPYKAPSGRPGARPAAGYVASPQIKVGCYGTVTSEYSYYCL